MLTKIPLCRTLLSGPTVCLFPGISYLQDSGLLFHLLPEPPCQQSLLPAVQAEGQKGTSYCHEENVQPGSLCGGLLLSER